MPRSRSSQVSLIDTPYYHCVSRCVRRCFLCGIDSYSGQSVEAEGSRLSFDRSENGSLGLLSVVAWIVAPPSLHVGCLRLFAFLNARLSIDFF